MKLEDEDSERTGTNAHPRPAKSDFPDLLFGLSDTASKVAAAGVCRMRSICRASRSDWVAPDSGLEQV